MKLVDFTAWHDDTYSLFGDVPDAEPQAYEEQLAAWEAAVQYFRQHGIRYSGLYHQKGPYGVPYFDTGKKLCLDLQAWGYLMAEVLQDCTVSEKWAYWADPDEFVLPYGEPSDDRYHWKNDPIARFKMEQHLHST